MPCNLLCLFIQCIFINECLKMNEHYIENIFILVVPRTLSLSKHTIVVKKRKQKKKTVVIDGNKWSKYNVAQLPIELFRILLCFIKTTNKCTSNLRYNNTDKIYFKRCWSHNRSIKQVDYEKERQKYVMKHRLYLRQLNETTPIMDKSFIEKKKFKTTKKFSKNIILKNFGFEKNIYDFDSEFKISRTKQKRFNSKIVLKNSSKKLTREHKRYYDNTDFLNLDGYRDDECFGSHYYKGGYHCNYCYDYYYDRYCDSDSNYEDYTYCYDDL